MKTYLLFIDESGQSYPHNQKEYPYILTGVVVEQSKQLYLLEVFNNLKRKYWNTENIIFHSEDMGKNMNEFSIFKGKPELKDEFYEEFLRAISAAPFLSFQAVFDKTSLPPTYLEKKVINKAGKSVIFNFLCYLLTRQKNSRGKIIIEASSTFRDSEYLNAFSYFLNPACEMLDEDFPDYTEIRKRLTQISFVTKLNHDIETQIADILGFAAYCMYKETQGTRYGPNSRKLKLIEVLRKKQFHIPPNLSSEKKTLFSKINSFEIIKK